MRNLAAAMKNPSLTVYTYTGSGTQPFAFNTKLPPFDDLRVRQALVMAIDRGKLLQAITNDIDKEQSVRGRILDQCEDDGALPFDPAKAKQLLKDYGKPVQFKLLMPAEPRGRSFGQVLQEFWKQVGAESSSWSKLPSCPCP